MSYFLLCVDVALMVIIWPVNRWVMKNDGRTRSIGLVITSTGTVLAALGALIFGQPLYTGVSLLFGSITAAAYAFGFCMIIFYCLKIGPSGPTVTLNNLGFLFPVLIGLFMFSGGKSPTVFAILGIVFIISSLVLMAFNKTGDESKKASARWFKWVVLGWLFSGISMGSQFIATQYEPDNPFTFALYTYSIAFLILAVISAAKKDTRPKKPEIIAGFLTGAVNIAGTVILFYLVKHIPAYVIYPVVMATPIIFMLVVGHYVYKEKMNRFGWAACIIGMLGLVLFNI